MVSNKPSPSGIVGGILAALLLLIPMGAAFAQSVGGPAGANLTGASGTATSMGKSGVIGNVTGPGVTGSSPAHPFVVARDGTVVWSGKSDSVITNHSWHVSVYGIQVKSGGSKNEGQKTTANGTEKVNDYLKVPLVGMIHVDGTLSGSGGKVTGDVWVKVQGSPVGTPLWAAGMLLFILGLVMAFFARPIATPTPGA